MNRLLMTVLLVAAAASGAKSRGHGHHGGGGGHGGGGTGRDDCSIALAPTGTEQLKLRDATTLCIAEQTGLQAIIDGLRGSGERHGGRRDVAALLDANGHTAEATTLRTCLARELGLLNADLSFNMIALKATISAKVTGLTALDPNTQLGLTNCPVVVDFNVSVYEKCVLAYCRTGAAPILEG